MDIYPVTRISTRVTIDLPLVGAPETELLVYVIITLVFWAIMGAF